MESARFETLQRLIADLRALFEARGIHVDGYGGGSKGGLVWHYDFTEQWPHPPDRASVRVSLWWGPIYVQEQVETVLIYRCAEIFRQGQPSSFKRMSQRSVSVDHLESAGLVPIVDAELDEGRKEIHGAS